MAKKDDIAEIIAGALLVGGAIYIGRKVVKSSPDSGKKEKVKTASNMDGGFRTGLDAANVCGHGETVGYCPQCGYGFGM